MSIAVSRRRLDVRGAVTIRIKTSAVRQQEALSDIFEKTMQLRRIPVQYPAKRLQCVQSILVSEELELGASKPPVLHIVRCDARPVEQSQKFVSGKLMIQGSLQIQLLYACEKDEDGSLEPMTFRIPYSQLLELEGLEEQDVCRVHCTVLSCDLRPVTDAGGAVRLLRCEAELRAECSAVRTASRSLLCDAFSTEHPCTCRSMELLTCGTPLPFSEMLVCNTKLPCTDGELDCVYDAWCEVKDLTTAMEEGEICISGMLCCYVLVRESSGMPRLLEKEEPFEHRFACAELGEQDILETDAFAENCTYNLSGAAEVSLKAELRMEGTVTHCQPVQVLSEVEVQEETTHPRELALKLYFGRADEAVWDIAKRCHTCMEAIMEENDLTQDTLPGDGMLLIPIVAEGGCYEGHLQ